MTTNTPFWLSATNAGDPTMMRYAQQVNSTDAFASQTQAVEDAFRRNFTTLDKSVDGNSLFIKAYEFHEARANGQLGYQHYEPLNQRCLQYFGLSTGGGVDPFAPIPNPKKYSCCGE